MRGGGASGVAALPLNTAHSGVTSKFAEEGWLKFDDLRACICRMDLSEVCGELDNVEATGALPETKGSGEGVGENRTDQVGEADGCDVDSLTWSVSRPGSTTDAGGIKVRLRLRVVTSSPVVMMTGQLVWERVMADAVNPKALGLGERLVAGEVAGLTGLAGRGAREGWLPHAAGMGDEICGDAAGALALVLLLALLPKKNVREKARRSGDLVAWVAAALLGCTGLSGGVSASRSLEAIAEEETKVGDDTKRVLEEPEELVNEDAAGVAGEGVELR